MFGFLKKEETPATDAPKPVTLLVLQADDYDWPTIFKGCQLADGRSINVVQTGWRDILVGPVSNYSKKNKCVVSVRQTPNPNATTGVVTRRAQTCFPDFLLIRNEVHMPEVDHRNLMYGFMYANIPAVNTLSSNYSFCERPLIQAELNRINAELGDEVFPIIPQDYWSSHKELMYTLPFPAVVKVGNAHAGFGKMRIRDHHDMEDFRSVLALTDGKYCTGEPFMEGEYDLRIQKIGDHIRAFKRTTISGAWKTNTGSAHLESIEVTPQYRRWALEAGKMFGGVDILSVDAIHCTDGKEYILEVNGGSSGLGPDWAEEDNGHIKDLVLTRMNETLCRTPATGAASS